MTSADTEPASANLVLAWDQLKREVIQRNPQIEALRQRVAASTARIAPARTLEDPQIGLQIYEAPVDLSDLPIMIELRQTFPLAGRQKHQGEVARAQADQTAATRDAETLMVVSMTRKAFARYASAHRALEVLDENVTLSQKLVEAALRQYEVGQAPMVDQLKAQEALARLSNDRFELEREKAMARAELNVLLDRPVQAALPPPEPLRLEATPGASALIEQALAKRPELHRLQAMSREADARISLARSSFVPEIMASVGYMVDPKMTDMWFAGAMVRIPLFAGQRQRPEIAAARAERSAAEAELKSARNQTAGDIEMLLLRMETAQRHVRLHEETLIPIASKTLDAARAAYLTGQSDFSSVLEAAQMLRMHHLSREDYLREYNIALAELEAITGSVQEGE